MTTYEIRRHEIAYRMGEKVGRYKDDPKLYNQLAEIALDEMAKLVNNDIEIDAFDNDPNYTQSLGLVPKK